jgi:hypothetical protein
MEMTQNSRRKLWRSDRRKAGILAGLALALILGLAACYPGGPENLGEIGVVLTFKNPQGNFSGLMTYAMEDTVVALVDPDDSNSQPIDPRFNPAILNEIQTQLANAGFSRIDDPDNGPNKPDVWISVGAVESETWIYYYSWPYYGGYPGWGWYYPPYVGGTSFQQGTVMWLMHDLRLVEDPTDPDSEPSLNWVGGLNGAIQNSTTENSIRNGIKQAFVQSPYIVAQPAGK